MKNVIKILNNSRVQVTIQCPFWGVFMVQIETQGDPISKSRSELYNVALFSATGKLNYRRHSFIVTVNRLGKIVDPRGHITGHWGR